MKKKLSIKNQSKKPYKLFATLAIYAVFVSWLMASGIQNLSNLSSAQEGFGKPTSRDFYVDLLVFLGVYTVRSLVLFLPVFISAWRKKGRYNKGWIYGGIIASIPAEIFVIMAAQDLATKTVCEANGDFDCGWDAFGLIAPMFYSCFAQLAGMLIGGVIYAARIRREA
jgi:F0F1-type ATP synthase assembly protein I